MVGALNVMFIGPAGCGKTTLTHSFGRWLEEEMGVRVSYINLDPGVLNLPYNPSYDVREIVRVEELMRARGLGPNGAMIKASEIIDEKIWEVSERVWSLDSEVKLIDTPGQMELFVFRPMGPRLAEALSRDSPIVAVYISDPQLASTPSGLAISLSMALTTRLRLKSPTVMVVNKADTLSDPEVEGLMENFDKLREALTAEEGLVADLALKYVELLEELSKTMRVVKVSAKTGEGMPDLYDLIHESLCECGDMM